MAAELVAEPTEACAYAYVDRGYNGMSIALSIDRVEVTLRPIVTRGPT